MVRYHRMKGKPTLWLPGTDHAGIATQVWFYTHMQILHNSIAYVYVYWGDFIILLASPIFSTISARFNIFFTRLQTLFQLVVERMLASEGIKRADLGRDEFTKRVWEWKEKYSTFYLVLIKFSDIWWGIYFLYIYIVCLISWRYFDTYILFLTCFFYSLIFFYYGA